MPASPALDPDFAEEVLGDFYQYRSKSALLAWVLWATLGIVGAHRFYLERPGTGLLMLFTGGGALGWWLADAFHLRSMVRAHGEEQERRRASGLPPLELAFMPPLASVDLSRPPEWVTGWRNATAGRRTWRLVGDVLVLIVSSFALAFVAKGFDVWEAIGAVFVLIVAVSAGAALGRWAHVPVLRALSRWVHRLRLFYYFNRPGSPPALLMRSVTASITAPFRRRDRAEVRLYLQLGAVFTVTFLLLDFGGELIAVLAGRGLPSIMELLVLWLTDAVITFVVIFGFATPIGATITLYLLVMRTHAVPRLLSALVAATAIAGLLFV